MEIKSINYLAKGNGKIIVALHGWRGSSISLLTLQDCLSKEFKVILIDLPGFGKSPEPDLIYGIRDYAKTLKMFLDNQKIKKLTLFGHSFGGQIATQFALDYPQMIENLILCSAAVVRSQDKFTKLKIYLAKSAKNIGISPLLKVLFRNSDYQKSSEMMRKIMSKIITEDLSADIYRINLPTLILWGSDDSQTPINQAKFIEGQIKNSTLKIFPGIRHNLPLVRPKEVAVEITKFIND